MVLVLCFAFSVYRTPSQTEILESRLQHLSHINFNWHLVCAQVALKRQQAVEDAIALRLVANKTGRKIEALPPGSIFGLTVTQPKEQPQPQQQPQQQHEQETGKEQHQEQELQKQEAQPESVAVAEDLSATRREFVSQSAIDMLAQLFPQRKRSVLELVLKRCDLDLIRAIENVSDVSAQTPPTEQATVELLPQLPSQPLQSLQLAMPPRSSAFRPVIAEQVSLYSLYIKVLCNLYSKTESIYLG